MKKFWFIWSALVIALLFTIHFSRHYLLGNPLARAYGKLTIGMSEKDAQKMLLGHYPAGSPEITPGMPGSNEVFLQWLWDGHDMSWHRKLIPFATDYEEHASLEIRFRDGKVTDATYICYRYAYPSRTDEYRTRGFYYNKTECLVPNANCPSETKYINVNP